MVADPRPANDTRPPRPSLFDRAITAVRREGPPRDTAPVASVAPPAGPPASRAPAGRGGSGNGLLAVAMLLATWAAAAWLHADARRETAAIERRSAPLLAARADRDRARAMLAAAWTGPTLGTTIEAVARGLPADASLLRVERGTADRLTIEVAAPDPDRVAAALRRDPALGGLRAVAQLPGDGGMRVTLEQMR